VRSQKEPIITEKLELSLHESTWNNKNLDKIKAAFRIKSFSKEGDSKVLIKTKFDLLSFGEDIVLIKDDDKIIIESTPSYKLTKIDYKRNRNNVEIIKKILQT
jgi:hypothetical protein